MRLEGGEDAARAHRGVAREGGDTGGEALFAQQSAFTRKQVRNSLAELPMHRGIPATDWLDWWQVFMYRFLDLEHRRGDHLNYLPRTSRGRAYVRASSLVIYDCCGGDGETVLPSERFTQPFGPMAGR